VTAASDGTDDLLYSGVAGQAARVAAGEVSALGLTEAVLARIEQVDPTVNAFTVVLAAEARAEAAARDEARARGDELGPLHGVPVAIKEENDVAGTVTTFGGAANASPARADGLVTRRLREAGAVVVGKTNMPEFGEFPFTESERFGATRNPWNPGFTPGGSSGGTAAAVATGMVPVGIGGDGGGSIRIPAAYCGLFGLKPTRGRVSTAPQPDLWSALGTVGPLTRGVLDSALVYDVVRGNQPGDRFTAPDPVSSFAAAARLETAESQRPLRVGWTTRSATPGVRADAEHVRAVEETAALLEGLGHRVEELSVRYPDPTAAFVPQFLAGVRTEARMMEHPDRLEAKTRQLAALGAAVRPGALAWAVRQGERLARTVDAGVFARCDVLLTPTVPHRPARLPVIGGRALPTAMVRSVTAIAYTGLWNVTGHPAASLPAGLGADGLPTAVQLVGRRGEETTLLALAAQAESVRPWAQRRPPV
jgi:amidase